MDLKVLLSRVIYMITALILLSCTELNIYFTEKWALQFMNIYEIYDCRLFDLIKLFKEIGSLNGP